MNQDIHRIYFFVPDMTSPSGGVRRLYRYAGYLKEAGYDAAMLYGDRSKGVYPFAAAEIPSVFASEMSVFDGKDVLIVPEVFGGLLPKLAGLGCRKVMISLSWDYVFNSLPEKSVWTAFGIENVLTTCSTIAGFIRLTMDIEPAIIRTSVNRELYYYDPQTKKNQICYTGRKDTDSGKIIKALHGNPRKFRMEGREVVCMNDLSEERYAQTLRESRILLTTALKEGVHNPILESLASGCQVVGYSGVSGREFCGDEARDKVNAALFEGGDYISVLRWFTEEHPVLDLREQSAYIHRTYSAENERADLLRYFEGFGVPRA